MKWLMGKAITKDITHLHSVFFPWYPSPSLGATYSYRSTKVMLLLRDWFVFIPRLGIVQVATVPFLCHVVGSIEPRRDLHSKTIVMREPSPSHQKNSVPQIPKVKTHLTEISLMFTPSQLYSLCFFLKEYCLFKMYI